MANPVVINLPANQWTKVATAVTSGNLYFTSFFSRSFLYTYRVTGDSAPSSLLDGVPFQKPGFVEIDSSEEIDVYVYCSSRIGLAGSVRVSL